MKIIECYLKKVFRTDGRFFNKKTMNKQEYFGINLKNKTPVKLRFNYKANKESSSTISKNYDLTSNNFNRNNKNTNYGEERISKHLSRFNDKDEIMNISNFDLSLNKLDQKDELTIKSKSL